MIVLRLPFPPSVNHYWSNRVMLPRAWAPYLKPILGRMWGKFARFFIAKGQWPIVGTFIGKKGTEFRAQVVAHMKATYHDYSPDPGRFQVVMVATMPDRRVRDLGNLEKASMDALTAAGIWIDDEQIDEITIRRGPVQKPGWLDVEIRRIEESP